MKPIARREAKPDVAASARNCVRIFIRDWRAIRACVKAGVSMDCDESDWNRYFNRLWSSYRKAQADARVLANPATAAPAHFFGLLQQAAGGAAHGDRP